MNGDALQDEIFQNRPFRNHQTRTLIGLVRTAGLVQDAMGRFFKERGLTMNQYNVLRILRGAGAEGLPSQEIGRRTIQRVPDMTRMIDRLERQGLARRHPCPEDRRVIRIRLTPRGRRLVDSLDAPVDERNRALLAGMSTRKMTALDRLLDEVRSRLESRE